MFGEHFYHEHTRRAVAVFGTLFNDIDIIKRDGSNNILSRSKVPLSYGPRQKFLARIRQEANLEDPKLAIKLPRMSFEITDISYDESTRLTRGTQYKVPGSNNQSTRTMFYPSTYRISFELSILSKHTDDALQILEQILPFFQPEYTVTVNEIDNNFRSDMPFTLTGVTMSDDYEGDFISRRSIIYTLTFETRVKYYGPLSTEDSSIIRETRTRLSDVDMTSDGLPYSSQRVTISPASAGESDDFSTPLTYDTRVYDSAIVSFDTIAGGTFEEKESVIGQTSGSAAVVSEINSDSITVTVPDEQFIVGETLIGQSSQASFTITDIDGIWNTLDK